MIVTTRQMVHVHSHEFDGSGVVTHWADLVITVDREASVVEDLDANRLRRLAEECSSVANELDRLNLGGLS